MNTEFYINKENVLLEVIAGSKSFGLDTETSDTDIKGVFFQPKEDFFGMNYEAQISNNTNDIVYYEVARFVELLQKNNPNILEILASPEDCILQKNPLIDLLKPEDFLSKLCKNTFAGYAISQIKKAKGLNKKIINPVEKERKSVLDFCFVLENYGSIPLPNWLKEKKLLQENCGLVHIPNTKGMYAIFYNESKSFNYKGIIQNENANEVSISSIPKGEKMIGYMFCNLDAYSNYCKTYREYWKWVEERNEERYNVNQKHGQNYDSKNMMHTIRLLQSCEHIFKTGTMSVKVDNRAELLDIKYGNKSYDEVVKLAENLLSSIDYLHSKSKLPEVPDFVKTQKTLISIREALYQ